MYKQLLLPLDGSKIAEEALPRAAALAERFQAELILFKVLVQVVSNISLPPSAVKRAEAATRELAIEYLDRVATRLQEKDFPIKVVTLTGRPHEEIVLFAETEPVDIVVISARPFGDKSLVVGSVADHVARNVNVPVLLIRASKDGRDDERISDDEPTN